MLYLIDLHCSSTSLWKYRMMHRASTRKRGDFSRRKDQARCQILALSASRHLEGNKDHLHRIYTSTTPITRVRTQELNWTEISEQLELCPFLMYSLTTRSRILFSLWRVTPGGHKNYWFADQCSERGPPTFLLTSNSSWTLRLTRPSL